MALLPARNILDGTALPVTSQMKTALGSLRDYCSDLLGTDSSNKAAARTALGAAASGANTDITSLTNLTGGALVNGAAGLGYGGGSGGTVTQATSKTTAVTVNKPCGQIFVNASSLAAGVSALFTLNNTLISAADCVIVNVQSSASGWFNYRAEAAGNSAGLVSIRLTNISASVLAESITLNFAIIKGVTA